MRIPEILWRDSDYVDTKWDHSGNSDDYSTLKWGDNNSVSKPTEAELKSKWSAIEQKMCFEQLRIARNKKLSETDWWGASDQTMTQKQKDYRKSLRDLPASATLSLDEYGVLNDIVWPTKPE